MGDDLLERLRQVNGTGTTQYYRNPDGPEAATTIEHLQARAVAGEARAKRLAAALRKLSFAAQTTGGTAGHDGRLQEAITESEQVLRDITLARAADTEGA